MKELKIFSFNSELHRTALWGREEKRLNRLHNWISAVSTLTFYQLADKYQSFPVLSIKDEAVDLDAVSGSNKNFI